MSAIAHQQPLSLALGRRFGAMLVAATLALSALVALAQSDSVSFFGESSQTPGYGDAVRDSAGGTWRRQPGEQRWRLDNPDTGSRGRLDLQADSVSRALYPRTGGGAGLSRAGIRTSPPR
ncbi:MAG: hypothetical protein AAF416_21420 [Pseudomonadota bacterium]